MKHAPMNKNSNFMKGNRCETRAPRSFLTSRRLGLVRQAAYHDLDGKCHTPSGRLEIIKADGWAGSM